MLNNTWFLKAKSRTQRYDRADDNRFLYTSCVYWNDNNGSEFGIIFLKGLNISMHSAIKFQNCSVSLIA